MADSPERDDEFVLDFHASDKNAPRVHHRFYVGFTMVVLAGIVASLIGGTAVLINGQSASAASTVDPGKLTQAETNYFEQHQTYTRDLDQLTYNGQAYKPESGTTVEVLGACSGGWVAKISSAASTFFLNSAGGQAKSLDNLELANCLDPSDLGRDVNSTVQINNLKVTRTNMDGADTYNGKTEAVKVSWQPKAACEPGVKPGYRVFIDAQEPDGAVPANVVAGDTFAAREFFTDKKSYKIAEVYNGMTYTVKVQGSCGTNFTGEGTTKTYTQTLPAPVVVMRASNGRYYPIVTSSGSPLVSYDIQYKHGYSDGWSTFKRGYTSGSLGAPGGYYRGYGDQFRARAVSFDGKTSSDYGAARGFKSSDTYSGYSSYNYGYGY